MELTPETFEKAEFLERRRGGYDIDQVETFLEEAGTEFARMLVKFKQAESRVADADAKAAAAQARVAELETENSALQRDLETAKKNAGKATAASSSPAPAAAPAATAEQSAEQASSVARALIIAQESADKALAEAKAEAQAILDSANGRAERQLSETNTKIDALVREAKSRADKEFASRREEAITELASFDERRSELGDLVSRLEVRIAGYRDDLRRAAEELITIADDPTLMGNHESTIEAHIIDDDEPAEDSDDDQGKAEALDTDVDADVEGDDSDSDLTDSLDEDVKAEVDDEVDVDVDDQIDDQLDSTGETDSDVEDSDSDSLLVEPASKSDDSAESDDSDDSSDAATGDVALLDLRSKPDDAQEESGDDAAADVSSDGEWEPGSWSRAVEDLGVTDGPDTGSLEPATGSTATVTTSRTIRAKAGSFDDLRGDDDDDLSLVDEPTEAIDRAELVRDRYLEELDQAVNNEVVSEDEAFAAFLEGTGDSKSRRFGWRR